MPTDRPDPAVLAAGDRIADVFGSDEVNPVKRIRKDLEKRLGPRGQWSAATCRSLWDAVMELRNTRSTSDQHELQWLRLCGWCLRPGFGASGDEDRLDRLWALHDEGLHHPTKANWAEWWIAWRRVAAGLDAPRHHRLFDDVRPWLWPTGEPPVGPHAHGLVEMMLLVAALERVDADTKERAGELFFARASKLGSYWPLGRVGARIPFHGDPADAVGPEVAGRWLARLLELDWDQATGADFAAASIARLTGDPARDVASPLRAAVADRLRTASAPASWVDMVVRASDLSEGDLKRTFGDSLPVGLRLA